MKKQGSGWIQKNRRSWPCPWSFGIPPLAQGICYEKIQKRTCSSNIYAGHRRILDKRIFLKNTCLFLSLFCIRHISLLYPVRNNAPLEFLTGKWVIIFMFALRWQGPGMTREWPGECRLLSFIDRMGKLWYFQNIFLWRRFIMACKSKGASCGTTKKTATKATAKTKKK